MAAPEETYSSLSSNAPDGLSESLVILTSTRRGLSWLNQRVNFWISRRPTWQLRLIGRYRSVEVQLKRLNFIHSGGWLELGSLPGAGDTASRKWVVFVSSFNRGWHGYFQAFLESFAGGIETAWGSSIDFPAFPGPDSLDAVMRFTEDRRLRGHLYSAYPSATTNDVRAALRRSADLEVAKHDWRPNRPADGAEDEQSRRRLQLTSGGIGPLREPGAEGTKALVTEQCAVTTGGTHIATVAALAPVKKGNEADLRAFLETKNIMVEIFKDDATHFAHLALLDRNEVNRVNKTQLDRSWLLLVADFDAPIRRAMKSGRRQRRTGWISTYRPHTFDDSASSCYLRKKFSANGPLAMYLEEPFVNRLMAPLHWFKDYPDANLKAILDALRLASQDHPPSDDRPGGAGKSEVILPPDPPLDFRERASPARDFSEQKLKRG